MSLIGYFHRWRLAKTTFWLPCEQQIHQILLADSRFSPVKDVLADQLASLYIAYRSLQQPEWASTFSYCCGRFYDASEVFTLCRIEASNAEGLIIFGGGMLSEIRLRPNRHVLNPATFKLEGLQLNDVFIASATEPLVTTGWIADFERRSLLSRYGRPAYDLPPVLDQAPYEEYAAIFRGCENASINIGAEQFEFLPPCEAAVIAKSQANNWLPILDLRDLGGLAIARLPDGRPQVSYLVDGRQVWSEPSIPRAIERLCHEVGEKSDDRGGPR
jgi:hypothetical protein